MMEERFHPLEELVRTRQRFVLSSHVHPDGDGLGSEVGLGLYLKARGKEVVVLNDGPPPFNFEFLGRHLPLESFTPERAEEVFARAEVWIVLDMQNVDRLGQLRPYADRPGLVIVILDHHVGDAAFGQVNIVAPEKAATGELVYDYVKHDPERFDAAIAEALYAALVTDTGSFRHSNTDPDVHAMAAHLLRLGVESAVVQARIHQHRHMEKLRFLGHMLQGLQTTADGTVAWFEVTPAILARYDVDGSDTEGLVDFPRTVPGVEVVALFTDLGDGRTKVSLRSSGRLDVNAIARALGGGGHKFAAGVTLAQPLAEARPAMVERLLRGIAALDPNLRPFAHAPAPAGPGSRA